MSVIVLTSEVGYKETAWQKEVQLLVKMVTVTQRSGLFLFFFFSPATVENVFDNITL